MARTPSYERVHSITASVFSPIIHGGELISVLDNQIDAYSHIIAVEGGFLSCEITLKIPETQADDWVANGLGRHIVTHGAGGSLAWEGFVNSVSLSLGNITIERGKLTDICNRCSVAYTPIEGYDSETGEPITGDPFLTLIADDEDSKNKYGIWEQVVSGGTLDEEERDEATTVRDMYLSENKEPELSHRPIIGGESNTDISLTISCRGYSDWLAAYIYQFGEDNLSTVISEKIIDVLSADPNHIISTDYAYIKENLSLINTFENENRSALAIINEALSYGDVNNNRWMFGIYADRKAYYSAIPTSIEYQHYIGDTEQRVLNMDNSEVMPWDVRPGKFAIIPDVLLGRIPIQQYLRTDQRVMFIEQVTFTAPNRIELQGNKIRNLDQYLARLGV